MDLNAPVTVIKGLGERRASALKKLGVVSIEDLLWHLPMRHEDRRSFKPISDIIPPETVNIRGIVSASRLKNIRRNLKILELVVDDGTGVVMINFFNQPFLQRSFPQGSEIIVWGNTEKWGRNIRLTSPEIEGVNQKDRNIHTGRIVPVYPMTAGITQKWFRTIMYNLIMPEKGGFEQDIHEVIPEYLVNKRKLQKRSAAFKSFHFPADLVEQARSRKRFAYEELLVLQTGLLQRNMQTRKSQGAVIDCKHDVEDEFFNKLPFQMTQYQEKVIEEIKYDLKSSWPMNRLLHGDVGSGKTVVAAWALTVCKYSGFQGAVMAPTEILAHQHHSSLNRFLKSVGINVQLLTGGTKTSLRKKMLKELKEGKIDVLVGTHALFSRDVEFKNLGIAVIDEQHRFGVAQRASLIGKGKSPNVLYMTATPIPRTLAITVYGDLEVSRLEGSPGGRGVVRTHMRTSSALPKIWKFINDEIHRGCRAYVVCPLIGDDESTSNLTRVVELHDELTHGYLHDCRVGLLHSRMSTEEKAKSLESFRNGELNCLISTTVVEVGVDVPEATVMVVLNAERFGLSQLHQLRGRIGRGSGKSYCILVSDSTEAVSRERLKCMVDNSDGFAIAEIDLKLRGPGEFFGVRQHGIHDFKVADILRDTDLLHWAREDAREIVKKKIVPPLLQKAIKRRFYEEPVA